MKFGKLGLVLVVVIVLAGAYFFVPNLLMGVGSDEARMTVKFVNIPEFLPDDLTINYYIDGEPIGSTFSLPVGTSHSLQLWVLNSDGTLYATYTRMLVVPEKSGDYTLQIDGTTRVITVI